MSPVSVSVINLPKTIDAHLHENSEKNYPPSHQRRTATSPPDGDVAWLDVLAKSQYGYLPSSIRRHILWLQASAKGSKWAWRRASKGPLRPKIKNYVFSRTREKPLPDLRIQSTSQSTIRQACASSPAKISGYGRGEIIASFLDQGEIDEFAPRHPILIGEGIPSFSSHRSLRLKLLSTKASRRPCPPPLRTIASSLNSVALLQVVAQSQAVRFFFTLLFPLSFVAVACSAGATRVPRELSVGSLPAGYLYL